MTTKSHKLMFPKCRFGWDRDRIIDVSIKGGACVIMLVVLVVFGRSLIRDFWPAPVDPMHDKVWIEFGTIQQALDVAGALGGKKRGLTVCVGSAEIHGGHDALGTWMPPGTSITGNRSECAFSPRHSSLALLHATKENSISTMTFRDSPGYGVLMESNHVEGNYVAEY